MPNHKFEILSPAGSLETLKCAINNGADAVYIGGQDFSARKNAVNFSNEEIVSAVRYAHLYDRKVYVTVNTLLGDSELKSAYDFIAFLYGAGVDAIIIQDLGVLNMVRKHFPDFEIHASTQMTIHNLEGAKLAEELGFKRVVLSRELTFDEIENISKNTDIELEVFVHGALCMSYSGQCLLSSFLGARSGNRGACAQPCRLPYTLFSFDGKKLSDKDKYLLSLKDLCLVEEMDTLKRCNVKSLKIEGRMKSSEYVALVTSIYDKYRYGGKVSHKDMSALANIFSRSGFTKGHLEGNYGRNMLCYDSNNDRVYDSISSDVHSLAQSLVNKPSDKIPFNVNVYAHLDKPLCMSLSAKGKSITVEGNIKSERALSVALTQERLEKQIAKTGQTPFELESIESVIDDGISIPVKEINELRRTGLELLADEICKINRPNVERQFSLIKQKGKLHSKIGYNAEVRTIKQAEAAIKAGFDKILVPYSLYSEDKQWFDNYQRNFAVILPSVARDNRPIDTSNILCEVYASNISQLKEAKKRKLNADFRLNVYNSLSMEFMNELGVDTVCLSPELNIRAINDISSPCKKEIIVYGRIPLMTVQNCIVKSAQNKCSCKKENYFLKDRKGVYFPLFTDKLSCTNVIYNSSPVYMADRINGIDMHGISSFRFIFTTETPEEIEDIKQKFNNFQKADFDFTRGHYYRGV